MQTLASITPEALKGLASRSLRAAFSQAGDRPMDDPVSDLFVVKESDRDAEVFRGYSGFAPATFVTDGQYPNETDIVPQHALTIDTNIAMSQNTVTAIVASRNTAGVLDKRARNIKNALAYKRCEFATDFLGDGFSSSVNVADGVSLFNSAHTNKGTTDTYSNVDAAAALSNSTAESLWAVIANQKTPTGTRNRYDTGFVFVTTMANRPLAERVFGAERVAGTFINDPNVIKRVAGINKFLFLHTLSDSLSGSTNPYFLVATDKDVLGLVWTDFMARKLTVTTGIAGEVTMNGQEAYGRGAVHGLGIAGNSGA